MKEEKLLQKIEYAKIENKKYNFNISNTSNDERIIIAVNSSYFFTLLSR